MFASCESIGNGVHPVFKRDERVLGSMTDSIDCLKEVACCSSISFEVILYSTIISWASGKDLAIISLSYDLR